jgi:hypothetical protein
MGDDTAQRKWQRILAEHAIARAEYDIAYQVYSSRPRGSDVAASQSPEVLAEQNARQRLLRVRERMSYLEAHSWLDAPGVLTD